MAEKRRQYSNTPLYTCRLNRKYPTEATTAEWLDNEIAKNIKSGGKGFREVLTTLVQREIKRKTKTLEEPMSLESRLERLVVTALNSRLDELAHLIMSRSIATADTPDIDNSKPIVTVDDVTGLIDDSDIQALLSELNGDFD